MPLIPETSDNYNYEIVIVDAPLPRYGGSIELEEPSDDDTDYQLKLAYRKYTTKRKIKGKVINMVFMHGNGMNKGMYHTYIDKLYADNPQLNVCIALDAVNHGDSAVQNKGKLGHIYNWQDGAKDICKVVTVDESKTFLNRNSINMVCGHSMSGFVAAIACLREPNLFDSCMMINPVAHTDDEHKEIFGYVLHGWLKGDLITSEFDIDDGNWLDQVTTFFKTKSFFKRFDSDILHNLIYDEYNGIYDPKKNYNHVSLKSSRDQQSVVYACRAQTISSALSNYQNIAIPTYHVVGLSDTSTPGAVEFVREQMKNVIIPIDVPNGYHCMNGESPQVILPIIQNAIDETVKNHKLKVNDQDDKKRLGDNYTHKSIEELIEDITNKPFKGKL